MIVATAQPFLDHHRLRHDQAPAEDEPRPAPDRVTVMRISHLALLACLALAACDHDPTFDASSPPRIKKVSVKSPRKLSAEDQRKLQIALLTLVLGNTAQSNTLQSATPKALNDLVTLDTVSDPMRYLERVRPAIGGRSGPEVIRRVASDLDSEISRSDSRSAAAYKLLTAVAVDHPRYYWDHRRNLPTIEFSVYNGSKDVLSRIYANGVLAVHGRAGKWVTTGLNYKFERGLLPGVAVPITVAPRLFSPQTAKQLEAFYDADVTVKVTNAEDASGQKIIPVDTDILEGMRIKRDFLRGS
jgi:hypothetical protein